MTIPQAAPASPEAALLRLETLTRRADFLRAARGRKAPVDGFLLQAWDRGDDGAIRVGFTCSRKVGNAVARNRAKRRLREVARLVLPHHGRAGFDYVLVGRHEITARRDFTALQDDLRRALRKVHP
nr:ribonuclease P protein component [Thalassococcus arenae]